MIISSLQKFYKRDLEKLYREIEAYRSEANLWLIEGDISNSAGNLCMHLVGNLNAYIGATLGKTGYVRDRPFEFAGRNIPRVTLLAQIRDTIGMVETVLERLTDKDLETEYPEEVTDGRVSTGYFLLFLTIHLDYHLGQINYHRRLLDTIRP